MPEIQNGNRLGYKSWVTDKCVSGLMVQGFIYMSLDTCLITVDVCQVVVTFALHELLLLQIFGMFLLLLFPSGFCLLKYPVKKYVDLWANYLRIGNYGKGVYLARDKGWKGG